MKKRTKIILSILSTLLVLILISLWFVGNYFVEYALGRKPIELDDPLAPSHTASSVEDENEAIADAGVEQWLSEIQVDEVNLTSHDGLNLFGLQYDYNPEVERWAIVVHGYTSHYTSVDDIAHWYAQQGYNTITPNLRAHGYSDGDYITLGYEDGKDILTWIDYVLSLNPEAEIVLHGVSMGAATVMIAAGEEGCPDNVVAVVEDCGYTTADEMMVSQLDYRFGLPSFPIIPASRVVSIIKAGYDFGDACPIASLQNADVPILFIHGDQDTYVPFFMLDELYNSYQGEKAKLEVEGAEHGAARDVDPDGYYGAVSQFLNNI